MTIISLTSESSPQETISEKTQIKKKSKNDKEKKKSVQWYQPFHTVCVTQVVSLSSLLIIK